MYKIPGFSRGGGVDPRIANQGRDLQQEAMWRSITQGMGMGNPGSSMPMPTGGFVPSAPAGQSVRGPAPVMPQMPQVPTMQNLPMQGGMVDFNALAGQMAGPIPDMSQFFSSPAPVMGQPSPFVPPGTKGPQVVSPPGKMPGQIPQLQMPQLPGMPVQQNQGGGPVAPMMDPGGFDKGALLRALFAQQQRGPSGMLDPRMGGLL